MQIHSRLIEICILVATQCPFSPTDLNSNYELTPTYVEGVLDFANLPISVPEINFEENEKTGKIDF